MRCELIQKIIDPNGGIEYCETLKRDSWFFLQLLVLYHGNNGIKILTIFFMGGLV